VSPLVNADQGREACPTDAQVSVVTYYRVAEQKGDAPEQVFVFNMFGQPVAPSGDSFPWLIFADNWRCLRGLEEKAAELQAVQQRAQRHSHQPTASRKFCKRSRGTVLKCLIILLCFRGIVELGGAAGRRFDNRYLCHVFASRRKSSWSVFCFEQQLHRNAG